MTAMRNNDGPSIKETAFTAPIVGAENAALEQLFHGGIINPSYDPFFYFIGLLLQFGTTCLRQVLAYSVWSNRPVGV